MLSTSQRLRRARLAVSAVSVAFALLSPRPLAAQDNANPCEPRTTYPITLVGVAGAPMVVSLPVPKVMPPVNLRVTPMTVERAYRGVESSVVFVVPVGTPGFPPLEEGRRYLVNGFNNFPNAPTVVSSLPPTIVEDAVNEIASLDAAELVRGAGTIYGSLTAGPVDDSSAPRRPFSGVRIRFTSKAFAAETITDGDGRFVMTGLPRSSIDVETLLPDGWLGGTSRVDVGANGCTRLNLVARLNGRIRGRVLHPNGKPMTWMVDLIPVDPRREPHADPPRSVRADEDGEYEFAGVQPGAYLMGVNLRGAESSAAPYRPTYFPGTSSREEAVPIVVGSGSVHEGVNLTLIDPLMKGQLQIWVKSDRESGAASLCVWQIGAIARQSGRYSQPTPVTVEVLEGVRYRFVGHVEGRDSHFESEAVEVIGGPERRTLTLQANTPARTHRPGDPCSVPDSGPK